MFKETKEMWKECKEDLEKLTIKEWWDEYKYHVAIFISEGLVGLIITGRILIELLS